VDLPAHWRLDGRVCVITGATAGIGRHAASALAGIGAELVIVGRSARRVARVKRELQRAHPSAHIREMVADLSSQAAVRALAARLLDEVPRVHVLINNAAVVTRTRRETIDGLEEQFAVNHLAPFLLTNLLVSRLAESAPSRVVTVASQMERQGRIDFDDLQGRRAYDVKRAYSQSKLANILFTRELARRVEGRGITPISVHPGVYATGLVDDLEGWSRLVTRLRGRGLPGPVRGAPVLVRAAAAPELEGQAGAHLHEHAIADPSPNAMDAAAARRLWEISAKLTGLPS
jgi:retinol dehydrogenase 14